MVQLSIISLLACSTFASAQWWNTGNNNNKGNNNKGNSNKGNNGKATPWGGVPDPSPKNGWNQPPAPYTPTPYNPAPYNPTPYSSPRPYVPTPTQAAPVCQVSVYVYTQAGGAQQTREQVRTHLVPTMSSSIEFGPYEDIYIEDRNGQRETKTRTRTREHPVTFTTTVEVVKTRTIIEGGNGAAQVVTTTMSSCR